MIYKLKLISTAPQEPTYIINSQGRNMLDLPPLQLIDGDKQFSSENLQTTIKALGNCGKKYYTVAIVGAQNSGKSTLLNNLFGTNFKMLNGIAGHRRDKESSLIIMDVEGNDSYESHLEGDDNYERMVGSFALVGANILLVNVFEKQLGQRKGSQYETLSTVMRICIDQFKQESPKTILFVLRDSNTLEAARGEVKRKIQQDVEKVWKSVWSGTKITPEMQKYQSNPDRFFTLEVAFLRQFDPDYPEQFQQDVAKLRQKFIDPDTDGYLFKRQNHQHNLPIDDVPKLLSKIWTLLTTNKELNLPNQKVQLANYRCEQVTNDIRTKFDADIDSKADTIRNYGAIFEQICSEFRKTTVGYAKAVTEKWEQQLLEGFRPKIRTVVQTVVQHHEKEFTDAFVKQIDELFYDPNQSFKEQSLHLQKKITEQQLQIFKDINFDIPKRKERIESLSSRLEELSRTEVKNKLEWTQHQFESDGQRTMKLVAATALKQYFGMEFWVHLATLFADRKKQLFEELQSRMRWARGSGATGADLDSAEQRLMQWLKQEVKIEFERGLPDKLFNYFKTNFQADQHGMRYDYNLLSEETVMERFTQAKEMALDLLKRLNNFTLSLSRYTSFIDVEDDVDNPTYTPFLEASTVLNIREALERRASEEYSSVMRRKSEARMKKTPVYLIALIAFFLYDDLWFSQEESPFMHYLLTITIVLILIPFALGQGLILQQALNIIADKIGNVGSAIWSKSRRTSPELSDSGAEGKAATESKDKTT